MRRHPYEKAIVLIALFGVILSIYGVFLHYAPTGGKFCNIGETFNCDKVNKSPWSTLFGIPVALLGALSYITVLIITLYATTIARTLSFTSKDLWTYLFSITLVMLAFQLYLTWIEIVKIGAYCIICLASQACTIGLATLTGLRAKHAR